MQFLLWASKVSLHIFFEQFLIIISIFNLQKTQQQTSLHQQYQVIIVNNVERKLITTNKVWGSSNTNNKRYSYKKYGDSIRITTEELVLPINN